jgi:hypothetical protein
MSDKPSNNEQLDNIKRHAGELVDDMRSRNLLLPAIVLVVAIVAALIVLPDKTEPTTQPIATPTPTRATPVAADNVIEITLITPTAIGEKTPLTSSSNPFAGDGDYTCKTISSGDPKVLNCEVSGLQVRVVCPEDSSGPPCSPASDSGGATGGGTGAAGGDTSGGSTGSSGAPTSPVAIYVYKATVTLDGKTYRNLEQGAAIPGGTNGTIVTFDGVNDTATRASFAAAAGSTVTGVPVDSSGLKFILKQNQTATITDSFAEVHRLKLVRLSKVKV